MRKSVNTSYVRFINLRAVLDLIFHQETISKAELARMLNMSKPSTADNVNDLLEIGIIQEQGEGACGKGGGRKPVLLGFCDNFKYIIVMDFHYDDTLFVLCNLRGKILNEFTIHQSPTSDFHVWTKMCINAVSVLMAAQGISNEDLAAIGISAPGILNLKDNQYIISPKYGEFNAAYLEKQLKETFDVPILIKNSTNAAVLGEFHSMEESECENLLYISCGQGVGAGLILRGKLYEGSHLASGEIGFFVTPDSISKQKRKRLEDRISIDSILEAVNASLPEDVAVKLGKKAQVSFPDMIKLWKENDPYISSFVEQICLELGCAACLLQSAFDCEKIIIGGEYLAFADWLIPRINQMIKEHCPIPAPVTVAKLGDKSPLLGLIATCREFYFKQICSRE